MTKEGSLPIALPSYQTSFTTHQQPAEALRFISNVAGWWTTQVEGNTQKTGDCFTIRIGDTFVTFLVTDLVANQKLVWQVTDCHLHWLNDKTEWNGTEVVWEVFQNGQSTTIIMTHVGLVPGIECYERCEKGWNQAVQNSLFSFLTKGIGQPA